MKRGKNMVKTKYEFIKLIEFIDDQLIILLEKEANDGWILKGISSTSLKFKKEEPQHLKYQIDFNMPSDEYKNLLQQQGYKLVDNFKNVYIYKNQNIEAEDLQTDETTRLHALFDLYSIKHPFLWLFAEFLFVVFLYVYHWLLNDPIMLGHFYELFNLYVFYAVMMIFFLISILSLIQRYAIRYSIKRQIKCQTPNYLPYQICKILLNVLSILMTILVLLTGINTLMYSPFTIIRIILITIIIFSFRYIITKKVYRYGSVIKRRLLIIATWIIYLISMFLVNQINIPPHMEMSPYMDNQNIETDYSANLFSIYHCWSTLDEDHFNYIQLEAVYDCAYEHIAKEIMKYEIVYYEREGRMPSEEEIQEITESTGQWSSDDIPYVSYQKALQSFQSYQNPLIDECYYNQQVVIARKNKRLLIAYINDENDIDNIIPHYFQGMEVQS